MSSSFDRRIGAFASCLALCLVLAVAASACGDSDSALEAAEAETGNAAEQETPPNDDDHSDDEHSDDDHEHESSAGLGAHEHGAAEMSVASIDGDVTIELVSPTFNVFGFEYEPNTEQDLATVADRTEALAADGVVAISDEAECELSDPVSTEVEREGSHSEITVSWMFTCKNPDGIRQIDATTLFAEFPDFEGIDVEWISSSEQSSTELTIQSPILELES